MAAPCTVFLLFFLLRAVSAAYPQNSSFSFNRFDQDPYFQSNIALFGDSKVVNGGSAIRLTGSPGPSAGRVMYKKPIKIVQGNPLSLASFSTYFSFSLSPDNGDGLVFVMAPAAGISGSLSGSGKFGLGEGTALDGILAVEFDTMKDAELGDVNSNHVGVDLGSLVSVKTSNVSSLKLVLNGGQKLQCWIDYEAGSRRLQVRLAKLGNSRPSDPVLSHQVDLWKMWNDEEVVMGLSSSNGNSNQTCFIYTWSFKLWSVPHWMHSQPLDPNAVSKDLKPSIAREKSDCFLKVLAALIFGTASGALGAFVVLYLWAMFGNRRPIAPEELVTKPVDYEYKKVEVVVVDKAIKDGR